MLVAFAALVAAVASPPLGGVALAALAVVAVVVERRGRARVARLSGAGGHRRHRRGAAGVGQRARTPRSCSARASSRATSVSAWLVATLRPDEILRALRQLGAPRALVELAALAARYVSVLGESLRTAREAQRTRLGWQRLGARVRSFGTLGGVVVARAVDQSVAIGEAMRVRGGGGRR